jgi:hypothetical protein
MAIASIASGTSRQDESRATLLGFTWRALIVAVIATVLASYWIDASEVVTLFCQITESVPPIPAVGFLVLLALLIPLTRRISRWLSLDRREVIIVYVFLTVATSMAGPGIIRFLINTIPVMFYFQTPANDFASYQQYMPTWIVPHDSEVIRTLYEGSENGAIPWAAWRTPLLAWGVFFLSFWMILLGLMTLLRRQWSEREKLTYPLVYLPMEMTEGLNSGALAVGFFRNPVMWVGFAISFLYNATNIINAYIPAVKSLGKMYDIGALFTERPWSAIRPLQFHYRPAVIGFGYLMSTEIAMSTWVFFIAIRLVSVAGAAMGYQAAGFPFRPEQSLGAYVALGLSLLWVGRAQLREALAKALGLAPEVDDSDEPMSYRLALVCLIGGLVVWLGWVYYAGMNLKVSLTYLILILLSTLVYARVRAEMGVPMIWAFPYGQHYKGIKYVFGSKWLYDGSWSTATMFTTLLFMSRGYFPSLVGYQVEGWRLADAVKINRRAMTWVLIIALVVGFAAGTWLHLRSYYEYGAGGLTALAGWGSGEAQREYEALTGYARAASAPNYQRAGGIGAGFIVAAILIVMRTLFLRFPLHPLAYGMATSFGHKLWGALFIVWLVKTLIFQMGGMAVYRALIPGFIGLALGHFFTAGMLYGLVGTFGGEQFRRYGVWFG